MIHCNDLSVRYPGQHDNVLHHVTVTLHEGETTLLVGPSGSGKTTFLHVLAGLLPDAIEADVSGHCKTNGTVGILFQNPDDQFCMQTVGAEVAFSLENRSVDGSQMDDRIDAALARVGLDVPLTTPIMQLSGGMKQRLALACVLALKPDILLLDEPTAQLDPAGHRVLMQLIEELHHDRTLTLVLIEHQLDRCVTFSDRVLVFDHGGTILRDGPPLDVFGQHRDELERRGIATPLLYPYQLETVPPASSQAGRLRKVNNNRPPVRYDNTFALTRTALGRRKQVIVDDLSLATHAGEWIMVVGSNGAGKSTLLETLAKLIPAQGGTVRLFEKELRTWKSRSYYRHVGFVFQQPELQFLKQTVEGELVISMDAPTPERIETALQSYRLTHVARQSPLALSMGQKRRLSVATMLLEPKDVLLLDEPTFGQDAETTSQLIEMFEQARLNGTTLIMVTHDMELVHQYADRVLVLGDGRLQFDGTPDTLFKDETLLEHNQLSRPLSYLYQQLEEVKRRAGKRLPARTY
ncbi:ATP-binding cassette domain-containing protein [Exiguobacterium sp. s127]|uniref:ABC transporter ATP-binding protein n=1 Tax=Exiguobacterium sp. s127 TaxID=2751210 RepID=UPI0020366B8F|nr:ATP-binding cassette domain-containing protein [Exiguobacterium sp. s127]